MESFIDCAKLRGFPSKVHLTREAIQSCLQQGQNQGTAHSFCSILKYSPVQPVQCLDNLACFPRCRFHTGYGLHGYEQETVRAWPRASQRASPKKRQQEGKSKRTRTNRRRTGTPERESSFVGDFNFPRFHALLMGTTRQLVHCSPGKSNRRAPPCAAPSTLCMLPHLPLFHPCPQ